MAKPFSPVLDVYDRFFTIEGLTFKLNKHNVFTRFWDYEDLEARLRKYPKSAAYMDAIDNCWLQVGKFDHLRINTQAEKENGAPKRRIYDVNMFEEYKADIAAIKAMYDTWDEPRLLWMRRYETGVWTLAAMQEHAKLTQSILEACAALAEKVARKEATTVIDFEL